jgi:hypothetical protein
VIDPSQMQAGGAGPGAPQAGGAGPMGMAMPPASQISQSLAGFKGKKKKKGRGKKKKHGGKKKR